MAAVNASPTYNGRASAQDHHAGQQHIPPSSQVNGYRTGSRVGDRSGGMNSPHHQDYQIGIGGSDASPGRGCVIHADQLNYNMYSGDRLNDLGKTKSHRIGERSRPCVGGQAEETNSDQNDEIQHLRTQVKSIGVLQELLGDARSENQALQDVVEAQDRLLREHRLEVSRDVQEKYSRLRYSNYCLPDSEWSVELKRPPISAHSHLDGRDQILEISLPLKKKDEETKALKEELTNLHRLLQSSEDEKSQEIAQLKQQLNDSSQDRQSSEAICRSLSGETEVLKTRLHFLGQECQKLSSELSDWKKKKQSERPQAPTMSDTPVSLEDQLRVARQQVLQIDREKDQLADQLKEVMRMNKRWQKYNHKQDAFIQDLSEGKTEAELQKQVLGLQCKDYEESMTKLNRRLRDLEDQGLYHRVDDNVAAGKDDTIRKLNKRVIDLEMELSKLRRESAKYDMDVVKQQLKQFTEDFQKEHNEKEKLKGENAILNRNCLETEERLNELHRKLDLAERENRMMKQERRRNVAMMYSERQMNRERRELIPHGAHQNIPVVSLDGFPTLPDDVQKDGPNNASPPAFHAPSSPPISPPPTSVEGQGCVDGKGQSSTQVEEPLQCPRCLREFPLSKHSDFMRHTEYCLDT